MTRTPAVVSVADHAGWAHIVAVAASDGVPVVIERRRITLIEAGLPTMPYHHESLGMPEEDANALIARVRTSIAACASRGLRNVIADLASAYDVRMMAIRQPQFSVLPDSVIPVRQSYQLQCAADGMMYQFALRHAADDLGLAVQLCRRGEEVARAAARLEVPAADMERFVYSSGRPPGAPWTEEHRRAFAAGIAALAAGADLRGRIHIP
jgi:hypothetical protein